MVEQKINTRKTEEGYYVEVLNDGKLAWTDTFETVERLNWFIKCCDGKSGGGLYLSQEEARKCLESGEYSVDFFYRHPMGYRFASITNHDVMPEDSRHGFGVACVDKDDRLDYRFVSTLDEAFQLIKDAEDGKV